MLNIHELETRWLRYKLKSFIPHFIISLSLIIIFFVILLMDFNKVTQDLSNYNEITSNNSTSKAIVNSTKASTKELNDTKIIPIENFVQVSIKKPEQNEKILIKPSLDFMNNIREDAPRYYNNYKEPKVANKKPEIKQVVKKVAPTKIITPVIEEIVLDTKVDEKKKISEIKIQRQDTQEDIQHVIKRFKKSNNPALSLFIAKKYYELGNYNESYNYALTTNEINNDIEDSWMIFSQSLYKLGKKDKAIEVLQKYISSSHSHRAKILLDNIKAGKIK